LLVSLLLATLAHRGVRSTEQSLLETILTVPPSLRDSLTAVAQVLAVVMPAAILVAIALRRRFLALGKIVVAGAVGGAAGVLVSHLLLAGSHPSNWHAVLTGRAGIVTITFPPMAWLAGMAAMVTVAATELPRGWRHALWWLAAVAASLQVVVGGVLLIDAVVAAAVGLCVGSSILLIFGEPPRRPTAAQVTAALTACGVDVASVAPLPPAREGPATFRAVMPTGTQLAVRVYATDDRDHEVLARLARWLFVREAARMPFGTSVESAAEHEMLAMVAAARAGGRVPEPVVAYPVARGEGPPGALVAWLDVGGRPLDTVPSEELCDATLADLWRSVSQLHQHRLAHGELRPGNVSVDPSNRAWLTGLVRAELGASPRRLSTDNAELLASLAVQIGVGRTVSSAVAGLGGPTVAAAAAYLQPLAVSDATRVTVHGYDRARSASLSHGSVRSRLRPGGRPNLYADLRTAVAQASGEAPAKLEPLARFTWRRTMSLLGAFALIYLVLPQLANAGAAVRALGHANWWWVLAALPSLLVAQVFTTLLLLGAIPAQLPFGPSYLVSLGGSFLNRVTPNNVGGMALNFRYLQNAGVDSGTATASVGLQTVAAHVGSLLLVGTFFAMTGRRTSVHLHLHVHQWVLVLIAGAVVGCALFYLTPRGRRFYHDKVWGFLRSSGAAIVAVARSPLHLALTTVGALGGPLVQIVALWFCVRALGGDLPFVQLGAVYLGSHLVASAAPVPGGLGAFEAALVAGLSALGMPIGIAASTVLIYRLLTYWLTIPLGWLSLKSAEARGFV
ncbi:MAG TPA: lysylphosphatidylglycerol synthase transmembrane domain-containing protein, partial [Acidimicrobiales bacterium]|nr:lysylphosphatidylglycerol synthase transmembrane domain-containing protein [Acidimicrobiales bacterium]